MPQGLLRAQKFLPRCGVAPAWGPRAGAEGREDAPGAARFHAPRSGPRRCSRVPALVPALVRRPVGDPLETGLGGVRALGAGGSPQFLGSAAAPASWRTRALFRALMAPKRVPASPRPRCPKLSFSPFSPFQTPSPILSGFVGFFHPTSLDNRPPRRLGRPGLIPPERHCLGDPGASGFAGCPVTQPHPPQTHFSASRPSPRLLLAPELPPIFRYRFIYFYLENNEKSRGAASPVPSGGASCRHRRASYLRPGSAPWGPFSVPGQPGCKRGAGRGARHATGVTLTPRERPRPPLPLPPERRALASLTTKSAPNPRSGAPAWAGPARA